MGADLEDSNLTGANLEYANLTHAKLYGANLKRVNLARARLLRISLLDVKNWKSAKGLEIATIEYLENPPEGFLQHVERLRACAHKRTSRRRARHAALDGEMDPS